MIYAFVVFASIAQTLLFLAHWFIYRTAVRFLNIANPAALLTFKIIFTSLSLTFLLATLLSFRYSGSAVKTFYIIAVFWLGALLYLFLAALLIQITNGLAQSFSFTLNMKIFSVIFFAAALTISIYGVVHATALRVTRLNIDLPNLPPSWQNKSAVFISDVHLGQVRSTNFAEKITREINDLKPDVVFIGGDLFDGGEAIDLTALAAPFSKITAPLGTYFITGNHEEFGDKTPYLDAVKSVGMRVLNNEMANLDGLQIIGVDYRDSSDAENFKTILDAMNLDKNSPSILLKHAPTKLDNIKDRGISLVLAGHTHNGQIFPVGLVSWLVYRGYIFGTQKIGETPIYITSGAGTWGPPMRVGSFPEIVLLKFGQKTSSVCFGENCYQVEIAATPSQRSQGLMNREKLDENKGMLFVFENEGAYPFWMKNTLIPLDIVWLNANKRVVFIAPNAQPCGDTCSSIIPDKNAKYVLEINAGQTAKIGLKVGDAAEW